MTMKKVMNGLLYDTDRATKLAHSDGMTEDIFGSRNDRWKVKLYMTENGRFFFHFTSMIGGFWWHDDSQDIKDTTEETAMAFCMKYNPMNFDVVWGDKVKRA